MKLTGFLFAAALLGACTQAAEENYTRHVDPKIGTGGHGHVFVGANVPFGLVQVGPTSIPHKTEQTAKSRRPARAVCFSLSLPLGSWSGIGGTVARWGVAVSGASLPAGRCGALAAGHFGHFPVGKL